MVKRRDNSQGTNSKLKRKERERKESEVDDFCAKRGSCRAKTLANQSIAPLDPNQYSLASVKSFHINVFNSHRHERNLGLDVLSQVGLSRVHPLFDGILLRREP